MDPGGMSPSFETDERWKTGRITAVSSGLYSFTEQWYDDPDWVEKVGGLSGDHTTDPGRVVNGATLAVDDLCLFRRAGSPSEGLLWELVPLWPDPIVYREPSWSVLTENTSPDSGKFRQLNGSFAWADGSTLTNVIYPVEVDGTIITPKPTANGIIWPSVQSGKYEFLPIQFADYNATGPVYYAGLVSTGGQVLKGDKRLVDNLNVDGAIQAGFSGTGASTGTANIRLDPTTSPSGPSLNLNVGGSYPVSFFIDPDGHPAVTGGASPGTKFVNYNTCYSVLESATIYDGASATVAGLVFKGGLYISGSGSSGTVTSVDVSGGTTGLTFSGGPVTTSGTITLGGTLAEANGGTGQTTFVAALVAAGGSAGAITLDP